MFVTDNFDTSYFLILFPDGSLSCGNSNFEKHLTDRFESKLLIIAKFSTKMISGNISFPCAYLTRLP